MCHANMPNVRIATAFSRLGYDLPRSGPGFGLLAGTRKMSDDPSKASELVASEPADSESATEAARRKPLPPAAQRALAEAEARRLAIAQSQPVAKEFQGPKGPEPTRYGDWENKGIASDF
jgi:hypothetical protein